MPLQVTYAGFEFHNAGIPHIGRAMQPDGPDAGASITETVRVQHRFFEESFGDNMAKWSALGEVLRQNPRGRLLITDENDYTHFDRTVRWSGHDGAPEWGEFRREIALTFECKSGAGIVTAQSATFTPPGRLAVTLPNVRTWSGSKKNERHSTQTARRREQMETISGSGTWSPPGNPTDTERREMLQAKRAEIESVADCAEGQLTYLGVTVTMQVDTITAEIGDGMGDLSWSITCFRRVLPDGTDVVADYQVETADDSEDARRMTTVSGKVLADSEAHARAEAERIRALYATGRIFVKQQTGLRAANSPDGEDPFLELSFTFSFREALDIISFKLKISTATDTNTADAVTTYSGNVVAKTAASALAKARELGAASDGTALFLMKRQEDEDRVVVAGQAEEFIAVTFSYTYQGKADITYAELTMETAVDWFGGRVTTVSGSAAGKDYATAIAFARQFKIAGVLMLTQRESEGRMVKDTVGKALGKMADFTYSYGLPMEHTTASYGREISHDYDERITTITFSGTAFGPGLTECNAMVDSLAFVMVGGTKRKDARSDDWKYDGTTALGLFMQMPFNVVFTTPLSAADAHDTILEATFSVATNYGLWKAQIDDIPYGGPWVQANVYLSTGTITVQGSVKATTLAAAVAWARAKSDYCTGYLDVAEVTEGHNFMPHSGTTEKDYTANFSFASRDPAATW